jgi:AAHS family 4-hydroxybenzoate transporter-like MFS transporter
MARMHVWVSSTRDDVAYVAPAKSAGGVSMVLASAYRRDTLLLWAASFANMLALYALISWLPTLLGAAGYSVRVASLGLTGFSLGGIVGSLAGSGLIDRFGSRGTLGGMAIGAATIGGIIALVPLGPQFPPGALIALLAAVGTCAGGFNVLLYPLALNLYPSAARATGLGISLSIGRLAAIASPFLAVALARSGGSAAFFAGYALCLLLAASAIFAIRRHVSPVIAP